MDYYYCNTEGKWVGPCSSKQIKGLATSGIITPATLIMSPEKIPPTPARKAKGLFTKQTENIPVTTESPTVTESGIFDNTFSFFSNTVSTIKTAIIPSRSNNQEIVPVQISLPIPIPEPEPLVDIGKLILHAEGGTKINGKIDEKFNPILPPGLKKGKIEIFVHERGLRMKQPKSIDFIIVYSNIRTVRQIKHKDLESATTYGTGLMLTTGFFLGNVVGMVLAGLLSQMEFEHNKNFILFEDGNNNQLLIEASAQATELFIKRYNEITHPKKWLW